MSFRRVVFAVLLVGMSAGPPWAEVGGADGGSHEVWAVDQADTRPDGGGTVYVYRGSDLAGRAASRAEPEVVDLGGAARDLCLASTGTAPRRAHMLMFNASYTHAIVSFVATGHVLFVDAATRAPAGCVDVGLQAHAAVPSPDESHVVVANQNGKLLQRISTDYATGTFAVDHGATLNLATCTTPNGLPCQDPALRPDTAPICPIVDATGRFTFVTLRGGGMFVVDSRSTPMAIVSEYDRATVHPNGCGGVEAAGKMYLNSGGGTPANPLEADLYAFPVAGFSSAPNPPNLPAPTLVFSHDDRGFVDSHGAALTGADRYVWVADRAANRIVVVEVATDRVIREIELAGPLSPDPAPDLLDVSPSGNRVYASLRGQVPLTANVPGVDNAVGSTPGVAVVRVERGGGDGTLQSVARITNVVNGVERADIHALRVRPL